MKTSGITKARASRRAEPHCWRFSPRPCAGEHFAVTKLTEDDIKNGDKLSCVIGDTYISYERMSPLVQWQHIALALRAHGLCVANAAVEARRNAVASDGLLDDESKELKK